MIVQSEVASEVFQTLRVSAAQLGRIELFAPWSGSVAPQADLLLHYVLEGSAWLDAGNGETFYLKCGAIVLIPHHFTHTLSDSLDTPVTDSSFWESGETQAAGASAVRRRLGGDGARTVLLCAALAVSGAGKRLLQEALPRLVHIQGNNDEAGPGLASLLELIRDEVRQARPAAQLLLTRYTEILVLQVLRAAPPSPLPNWRAAATQPGLARALSAIHSRPSEVWSVEMLSKEAGMSRSAFADAFTRSVGEGPIRYLTRWRLALAKDRLESETSISVEAVAAQVGYANAAAFSTAFRREFGVAPGGLRRR